MEELHEVRDRLLSIGAAIAAALLAGAAGYHFIEGWSWLDSLYMTVITLSTVGYGETHQLGAGGRAFTMLLILGGISVMTYSFSTITSVLVEGDLSKAFKRRRMQKEIDRMSGHYIICGGGHAGGVIGSELKKTQRPFVIVDRDAEALMRVCERLGEGGYHTVAGDATADETLKRAGVERAAGVFAVLATDQDNAFVALSAKGLNPKIRVVSAQKELGVREKLFRSGADNVVNPEFIGGLRMASEMIRPVTVGFLDSMIRERGEIVRFEEVHVPAGSPYVGKPIETVKGADGEAPLCVAILPAGASKYEINPPPSRPIAASETLVMLGEVGRVNALRRKIETT
jgi:voltage-gated potassium channel